MFSADSKKDQIKLLKGQSLTPDQLANFLFRAYADCGYVFSSYRAEQYHKGLDEATLPKLISLKNDEVKTVDETTLTEGQLKNVILHRRVVVAKIQDKGNDWHCFFLTYKSLRGEESWKDGQPHLHYISSKWGIARAKVI